MSKSKAKTPQPKPPTIAIQGWAVASLEWSKDSPDEGALDCTCMVCHEVIGAAENDPRWFSHDDENCIGCPLCEIAVRLCTGEDDRYREQRFHPRCFKKILAPQAKPGPVA
jgi:hypothetical protein